MTTATRTTSRNQRAGQEHSARRMQEPALNNSRNASKQNQALNGLKAIAIFAVIFYHLDVAWLPSGHLGVIIFLVLSGYFYTRSLMKEIDSDGRVVFTDRIVKRISRLWPSVAILIITTAVLCMTFNHVLLTKMKPDMIPGLTFTLNIANVVRNTSYFDNFGATSPLLHLWYLGIDMQFCILWPYLLYMFAAEGGKDIDRTRHITFALACISALWMAYLYVPEQDPSRIYYSLDTRAFSPLIGACIALYPRKGLENTLSNMPWIAPASLAGLIIAMIFIPKAASFYYIGGMFAASILAALIIGSLNCKGPLTSVLGNPILAKIGQMSLSIYLWHYPIILLLNANSNTAGFMMKFLAIGLTLVAGTVNFYLIEQGSLFQTTTTRKGTQKLGGMYLACALAGVGVFGVSHLFANETLVPESAMQQSENAGDGAPIVSATELNEEKLAEARKVKVDLDKLPSGKICLMEDPYLVDKGVRSPFMIGDSVPTAVYDDFARYFPNGKLDAKISRRPDVMQELLNTYLAQGIVGDVVILQAFNNTSVSKKMLEEMIQACEDREVYLVNIKVPESIEGPINRTLSECASEHDNVHLIDWNSLVSNHLSDYLWGDETHLKPGGYEPYVNLIANSIADGFARKGGYILSEETARDYREKEDQVEALEKEMKALLTSSATSE